MRERPCWNSPGKCPGESDWKEIGITIPGDLAAGDYRLIAEIQGYPASGTPELTFDGFVDPNVEAMSPTVAVRPQDIAAGAAGSNLLGKGWVPGDAAKLSVQITNTLDTPVKGPVQVSFYASADGSLEGAVLLGSVTKNLSLKGGKSATVSASVKLPSDLEVGSYRIVAVVDSADQLAETNELNNTAVTVESFDVLPRDLVAAGVSSTLTGKAWLPGESGKVSVQITNPLAATVKAPVQVSIYASTDGTLENAVLLGAVTKKLSLKGGKSATLTTSLKLPAGDALPDGSYKLIAVVDSADQLAESNEANNTAVSAATFAFGGPFVDLATSPGSARLPQMLLPGSTGAVGIKLTNHGNTTASGTVRVELYLTTDPDGDSGGVPIGILQDQKVNIRRGSVTSLNVKVQLPADLEPDTYYLVARLRPTSGITDADWNNNDILVLQPLEVQSPPSPAQRIVNKVTDLSKAIWTTLVTPP